MLYLRPFQHIFLANGKRRFLLRFQYERGDTVNTGIIPDTKCERCVILGEYIIDNNATVRSTAKVYGISKSTVHQDVTVRLAKADPVLAKKVREVLQKNKDERHIRGGLATKLKYSSSPK